MAYERPSMNQKRAQSEANRQSRSSMWDAQRSRNEEVARQAAAEARRTAAEDHVLEMLYGGARLTM